ncbi:hypothetical protein Bca52824_002592 [Brassica carinata]|uniref:Cysteine-rich receptor-like protein kinase 40 n=1 Tax=Brassica carinata TaxID=52824 RepID=A0A8X7WL48_BRACI|nr:hypothetical protein Bca52824_002592 [Brassica carinata]
MGSFPALMITLASSLLFFLQTLEVVNGVKCYGSLASNRSYAQNRRGLFSTLASNVVTNGGFYNASLGQYPNKVYVLGLCARGYEQRDCSSCVEKLTLETQTNCGSIMDSFIWGSDVGQRVFCVWEYTVNKTLKAATKADTSSVHKYYSAVHAEFTEFQNVYMMMQCTPDITSHDCKQCLGDCVKYFREQFRGKTGGMASFPSCLFRWDLYPFQVAFGDVTRVPALSLPQAPEKGRFIPDKKGRSMHRRTITLIVVITFINLLVFIVFFKVYARKRKLNNGITGCTVEYAGSDGHFMLRFDLSMILMATADFSPENKLGQGGFGTVYKGMLLNGKEIAVKRLTRGSEGGDEEILVYEFLPNSSLDRFIFDEEKRPLLTWEVRFKIIEGIAQGLVYLHEESQVKIIHRDVKASNILLDEEMNPKVADFGTARLFDTGETRAETKRIAGTRGYMAPEYLNHGQISAKSDVYSFGVVLLEMISGRRNNSFVGEGIAAFAWKRWVEGRPEFIIDPLLVEKPSNEIIKLIQIGLLCAQQNPTKRPTMSTVIVWLGSEAITIPLPKAPAFTVSHSQSEDVTTSMSNLYTELSCR